MSRGTAANLSLSPGYLYIAELSTPEPTDLVATWTAVSANWKALGYTKAGSEFKYSLSADAVEVAEELDPVSMATTGRTSTVTFALAEISATNLMRAMNAPTSAITAGSGSSVYYEPPDLGTEVRRMLGFESEDHTERWIFRRCFQTGDTTITRGKGADNATIAVEFTLEKPTDGSKLFKAIMGTAGAGGQNRS